MKYLHTMLRVHDLEASVEFFRDKLGLKEISRHDVPAGRFTLAFLAPEGQEDRQVELTYNWPPEDGSEPEVYGGGRNFGHLAYKVDNLYEKCQDLMDKGVTILRPPRDGRMAFVKSPDGQSIELLQKGEALPVEEPWASMPNSGSW